MNRDVCEHFNPVDLLQGCPSCEYNKARAQLWRNEAYKLSGHPLDWEPELMVRPKPLTEEEIDKIVAAHVRITDQNLSGAIYMAMRDLEAAHGIGEKE